MGVIRWDVGVGIRAGERAISIASAVGVVVVVGDGEWGAATRCEQSQQQQSEGSKRFHRPISSVNVAFEKAGRGVAWHLIRLGLCR
jgi:hypothetical protein